MPVYGKALKDIADNWSAGQPPIMLGGALEPTLMLSEKGAKGNPEGIEPYMLEEKLQIGR